ncbi:hypothetical protein NKH18_40915 [Streptomyces sp. M10(2022)]
MPGTAYEQAEALATLLAQLVYPGIGPRFRPVLQRSPVVQAAPFPLPRHVSAGQADRLAVVPGRVRERLVELWRSARDRDGLTEAEIDELTVLFGLRMLEHLELHRHPVRALRELLHRSARLLAPKLRRLDVLTARPGRARCWTRASPGRSRTAGAPATRPGCTRTSRCCGPRSRPGPGPRPRCPR